MFWQSPHISKVYEALTAIADGRITLNPADPNSAKVSSSSKGKYYEVKYDPETGAMMSNDNSAFFTGKLSYPMIAMLMLKGVLPYPKETVEALGGFFWKKINLDHKRDYDAAVEYVLSEVEAKGFDKEKVKHDAEEIYKQIKSLKVGVLGKKRFPPKGY